MWGAKGYGFLAILVWNRVWFVWFAIAKVFLVVANTRTKSIKKQIKSINVDKAGSKKTFSK